MFPSLRIGDKEAEFAILQGGMAIRISMAPLAAKVANAGGVGIIAASGLTPDELRVEIWLGKHLLIPGATGRIGVNVMWAIREFKALLQVCIEEGVDFVFVGAGILERWAFEMAEGTNTIIVPIVSRAGVLRVMVKRYGIAPLALVGESVEAGGHLGTDQPTDVVTAELVEAAEKLGLNIPVIPAGGIRTGADIRKLEALGGIGGQLGTPFALTDEVRSYAPGWQDVLLSATEEVVVGGKEHPVSPTKYPGRYVMTPAIERLCSQDAIHLDGKRPSCARSCLTHCAYRDTHFCVAMCIFRRLVLAQEGNAEEGVFFTGKGVAGQKEIVPAKVRVDRLVAGYNAR